MGNGLLERESVLRVLDANFNRAAEGLRTIEDIARLVFEDRTCAGWIKSLRHQLGELAKFDVLRSDRLLSRSTASDAGIDITDKAELKRTSWQDLLSAACERITQSLRAIEEVSKAESVDLAQRVKQLRYRAYDRLAAVELRLSGSADRFRPHQLYLLIDCKMQLEQFCTTLRLLSAAGVGLFQLRDKQCEAVKLLQYSRAAVAALGPEAIIVNDRVDIALASGAGGVHVGQEDLGIDQIRSISRGRLKIGVSTHNLAQARQAQADGADYIGCEPTFTSATKQFDSFAGLDFLEQVGREIDIPSYAIGGITVDNVLQVRQAGICHIAVSNAILAADHPAVVAAKFIERLQ